MTKSHPPAFPQGRGFARAEDRQAGPSGITPPPSSTSLTAPIAAQVVLLAVAGWNNVELQNTDAVAYLRLASYYATGQMHLAVSGYWGPLLSWLMAPLLAIGVQPLVAARLVMAFSAVVFLAGSIAVFRGLGLPPAEQALGAWVVALATVYWSVQYISPDLLVGGLICLAIAAVLEPAWIERPTVQIAAGMLWGLAYYAKAVAFPLAFLLAAGVAAVQGIAGTAGRKAIVRALVVTLATFLVVATPWMIGLSLRYGTLTVSTSGQINRAIVGPMAPRPYHGFSRMFHEPVSGRITSWEDPSPTAYRYWSPLESREHAVYQLRLAVANATTLLRLLASFDWFLLGLVGCVAALALGRRWRQRLAREPWRWSVVVVGLLPVVYLPGFVKLGEERYLYGVFPFLLACAFGATGVLSRAAPGSAVWMKRAGLAIVALSFALPAAIRLPGTLAGLPHPGSAVARELARRLEAAGIRGPIAGSGDVLGERAGLYTAFFLNQPWHGDEPSPSVERYRVSRAELIVVNRSQPVVAELDRSADFRSLDHRLFSSETEAARFLLKVYQARWQDTSQGRSSLTAGSGTALSREVSAAGGSR